MAQQILVVDNYDSFVYTLVGYVEQLGARVTVVRNDDVDAQGAQQLADSHAGVLISPGPGAPAEAGISRSLIAYCREREIPLLGVCLGLQTLAEMSGATVRHAPQLMHGKTSDVRHSGGVLFEGVPEVFTATRYHSLSVDPANVPPSLEVSASTSDGVIMGLSHRSAPLHSVQFHPESVMTGHGHRMVGNWLELCGVSGAAESAAQLSPLIDR